MTEYINREAVINLIENECYKTGFDLGYSKDNAKMVELVNAIPAVEVAPVKPGTWLDHQMGNWIYAKCSECGTVHDVKSHFCPHCGKKMDLGVITND